MRAAPFNAQNAAEMARRSHIVRAERKAALEAELERQKQIAALSPQPHSDDARLIRVKRQIDSLLDDMEDAVTVRERMQIGAAVERLWKLVQPTAGALKPQKQSRNASPAPQVVEQPASQ